MAGLRISQLPAATAVASADIFPFSSISGSQTRKVTATVLGLALTQLGLSVGSSAPLAPYNGQPWMDIGTNPPVLKVWNGATWTIVSFLPGSAVVTNPASTAPPSPVLGQLWQDVSQTPDALKMWDGSNWVRPDPLALTQTTGDSRYLQIADAATTYLALTGGTLTGNLTLPGAPSSTNMAATKGYVDTQISAIPPADTVPSGTIIWTARNTAPTGYLKANGAAISRTTYAALYAAIGTTYGAGNGSTTFNVPDLRGEFIRGWDDSRGVDSGRVFGSQQAQDYASHSHGVSDPGHAHSYTNYNSTEKTGSGGSLATAFYSSGSFNTSGAATGISINNSGGTETRPRNVAMLACVKT